MVTASLAKHSRSLTENLYHNGHPDLIVQGAYAGNSVMSGSEGVEIKTTRKAGVQWTHMVPEASGCAFGCMALITNQNPLVIDSQ